MRIARIIIGKTKEEANEALKNLGYFVCGVDETLRYENQVRVACDCNGVIGAVEEDGKWITTKE